MLASAPRSLRALVQLLLLAIVLGAAYLYAPPIGAISGDALQHSLARALGGTTSSTNRSCVNQSPGVWSCQVDDPGSGGTAIAYQLTRHGRRCWSAAQVNPGQGQLPPRASGCVGLRDQVRPEQRL